MVAPFPPGGVADTVARPVAEALSRELADCEELLERMLAYVRFRGAGGYLAARREVEQAEEHGLDVELAAVGRRPERADPPGGT